MLYLISVSFTEEDVVIGDRRVFYVYLFFQADKVLYVFLQSDLPIAADQISYQIV